LHERLTQRFVDRRTAVLVRDIGARGADALPVTVAADGEVSVGPEPIGHLAGFDSGRSIGSPGRQAPVARRRRPPAWRRGHVVRQICEAPDADSS
jgi:ATP-dependent RNA helicase SUPV3L1/SUV3